MKSEKSGVSRAVRFVARCAMATSLAQRGGYYGWRRFRPLFGSGAAVGEALDSRGGLGGLRLRQDAKKCGAIHGLPQELAEFRARNGSKMAGTAAHARRAIGRDWVVEGVMQIGVPGEG
jgi:hypothetical protein